MGRLVGISMAGVDERTDLDALSILQSHCDHLEFGIILSKNWSENGNRYWNPEHLSKLKGRGLNLCAHLCGSVARAAIQNDWGPTFDLLGDNAELFDRVQLNIKSYRDTNPKELDITVPSPFKEVIIQQHASYDCKLYYEWYLKHKYMDEDKGASVSVLIDGSGGTGKESKLIPLYKVAKVGYAGGLGPHNIYVTTRNLLANIVVYDFWVDMESGLRTDDWFDVEKAEKVISEVDRALKATDEW